MAGHLMKSRTTIGVRDVTESISFYERAIGFHLVVTMGEPPTFALLAAHGVGLGLVQSPVPPVAAFVCCYFDVEGVEDLHERCVHAGATVTSPLTSHPWGSYDFVISDPDGNLIAFGEPPAGTV